ncbi:hypothetical protein PIB30_098370 [Stylosanthes scabra]|uniref:Uncharacterized protein n=1 Tax=Stylosanthes scabra TaxID=79078 RepID=A0ABU6UW40_9FABA|nr:hypothetical protein [Stylosanthes scabra]
MLAEAGKDFVDSLFSFLTLPLADIVRLAGEESNIPAVIVGCLTTLYQSVAKLDNECLRNETCKKMLLHPRNMPMELYRQKLKLNVSGSETLNYFQCSIGCSYLSAFSNVSCCFGPSTSCNQSTYFGEYRNGFVKENNFIICDDLYVMPNSIDNCLPLLQNHGVQNINDVLERTVIVSKKEKCAIIPGIYGCYPLLPELDIGKVPIDSGASAAISALEQRTLRIGFKEYFSILKASLFSQSALTNGLRHHLETTIKQEKKP